MSIIKPHIQQWENVPNTCTADILWSPDADGSESSCCVQISNEYRCKQSVQAPAAPITQHLLAFRGHVEQVLLLWENPNSCFGSFPSSAELRQARGR